jgi:hypothetical protein
MRRPLHPIDCLKSAGQRPLPPTGIVRLYFGLFRHFKGVVNLDFKIAYRAFQFGMPEQQLNGLQILGAPIDQRRFRPPQRMRPIAGGIQS